MKRLFNTEGNDLGEVPLLHGNATGILNLNNVKYPSIYKLYDTMTSNFWLPEKIDMSGDDFSKLTLEEQKAFKGILSFLIFLDSVQVNVLMNFNDYFTNSEVSICLALQAYQETIHTKSYQHIIESVIPVAERDDIYDFWRTIPELANRNNNIAEAYEVFRNNPTDDSLKEALVASYVLEGLYFFNGFNFFYNLASRGLMLGTSEVISLINRDELTHCVLAAILIKELDIDSSTLQRSFEEGYEAEIEWSSFILGDSILGITTNSTEEYTKHLVNRRLKNIGLEPMFEATKNPYKHLERISNLSGGGTNKSNFFESSNTTYVQANILEDWDF